MTKQPKTRKVKRRQRPGRFAKTYCDILTDAKLARLMDRTGGREAFSLWALANTWTSAQRTDGHIPREALRACYGREKDAASLVAAGLWVEVDDGWQVPDYWYGNQTRADDDALKLGGQIAICDRWMRDKKEPRPCSCGHHDDVGALVGDPVGDLLRSQLPPEAFDA